jgi:hypothetical protein
MTYASAGLIQATDYNALGWTNPSIGGHWGIGSGAYGLGQSTTNFAQVAATNGITAAQWTGLISAINSCLAHEGQATITPTSVAAGALITYYSSIATGSQTAYNNSGTTGIALIDSAPSATTYATAWGNTGSRSLVFTRSVTFASGDAARYFFNAGGKIKLTFSRSGGSATTRNTEWATLCSDVGTITMGWKNTTKVGGAGATPLTVLNTNNGGYWAGSGAYVVHFKQLDNVGSYSNNYIQVEYYWSGTVSNGGYPVLNIKCTLVNVWTNAFQDTTDGTYTNNIVVSSPATTYLANSWGTPTVGGSAAAV